jgi:glutathione S-transferase
MDEANRVTAVLEGRLARQKEEYGDSGEGPWFAGNKLTKADAAFHGKLVLVL